MQDNQNNNHINSVNNINVSNEGVEDSSEKEILSLRSVFDASNKHPDLFFALLSFLLGSLCMFLLLFFSQRICNKDFVLLFGDGFKTASNIRMCARNILSGESIYYSYSISLGMNTALLVAYDFLSPFNILYILFYNADANVITAVIYILKTGLAAMLFQIFVSKYLKCSKFESLMFGLLYSMCGFAIWHGLSNNMWADALYALPIVCIGIFKLVKENKFVFLVLAYAYIFVVNFYMAYNIGFFTFLFFFLLVLGEKELNHSEKTKRIVKYIAGCVLAVIISAAVWMPTLYCVLHYSGEDASVYRTLTTMPWDLIGSLLWGQHVEISSENPYLFCGVSTLMLFPFFFFNKEIDKRKKITAGVLLLFSLCCIFIKPFYIFIHAFDAPIGFDFRFSYIVSFILCCVAAMEFKYLGKIRNVFFIPYFLTLLLIFLISQIFFGVKEAENIIYSFLPLASVLFFVLWFVLFALLKKRQSVSLFAIMIILLIAEVTSNGVIQWKGYDYFSYDGYKIWSYYNNAILDDVKEASYNNAFERISLKNDMIDTSDSYWGYNGIDDFGTNDNPHLRIFLQRMGLFSDVHLLHSTGINPVLNTLLGIKTIYVGDDPLDVEGIAAPLERINNDYYVSVGYMVDDEAQNVYITESNSFENNNKVIEALTGVEDVFFKIDSDKISYIEDGIRLLFVNEGVIIDRDGIDFPKLLITAEDIGAEKDISDFKAYMQFDFNMKGYDEEVRYAVLGMANQMGSKDYEISYGPMIEMTKNDRGYSSIIASYLNEPDVMVKNLYFYGFDGDAMKKAYDSLASEPFVVTDYGNGYIKGNVNVTGERRLLFMSIPYIEGWKLYVNGEEQEIVPLVNNDFIGVRLPDKGNYEIELKYSCPLLKEGTIVSSAGLILLIGIIITGILKRRKTEKTND